MKGCLVISRITTRSVRIHDGVDWCEVIIDINVPDQEIIRNTFEQIGGVIFSSLNINCSDEE